MGRAGVRLNAGGDEPDRANPLGMSRVTDRLNSGHDRFQGGAFTVGRASHITAVLRMCQFLA